MSRRRNQRKYDCKIRSAYDVKATEFPQPKNNTRHHSDHPLSHCHCVINNLAVTKRRVLTRGISRYSRVTFTRSDRVLCNDYCNTVRGKLASSVSQAIYRFPLQYILSSRRLPSQEAKNSICISQQPDCRPPTEARTVGDELSTPRESGSGNALPFHLSFV